MRDVAHMDGDKLMNKWFPDSVKVKAERFARHACEKLEFTIKLNDWSRRWW